MSLKWRPCFWNYRLWTPPLEHADKKNCRNQPNLTKSSHAPNCSPGSNIWTDLWFQLKINNAAHFGPGRKGDGRRIPETKIFGWRRAKKRERKKTVCPNGFRGGARAPAKRWKKASRGEGVNEERREGKAVRCSFFFSSLATPSPSHLLLFLSACLSFAL